jgi:hypothetical protein
MRFILLLIAATSTPALAAEQYDLACQGTKISKQGGPSEAYAFRVRIDLTGKKWCQDSCERVLDIYEIGADQVVLADDVTYNSRTDLQNKVTVDRKSNAFHQLAGQDRPSPSYLKVEAACTEQPFTPFPKAGS